MYLAIWKILLCFAINKSLENMEKIAMDTSK